MNDALRHWTVIGDRDGPHLLITGGVHGDEFEPMAAIWRLIREILPADLRGRLTLIPCVNEAAFRRTARTAEDGLDLARTCPGPENGTITQQVAHSVSQFIRSADFYVDLHTGGVALKVYPLVGYMLHACSDVLETQRRMAGAFGLPLAWGTDPSLNGRSLSVARDANVPAIYAEYLGGGECNPSGVEAYVRGCKNVAAALGMIDQAPAPHAATPLIIEDARPNSGFMQINHPAPCAGVFQPALKLGQKVERGDLFGTILNPFDGQLNRILADHSGYVIVQRNVAHVAKDDSLGVVLETDGVLPALDTI